MLLLERSAQAGWINRRSGIVPDGDSWISEAAGQRGKRVEHGLQTNMLAYTQEWDRLIAEMFGSSVSTSLDYPNLHRKVPGRDPRHYDALWARKVEMARAAGIDVKVISVLNQGMLDIGAARFYEHLVDEVSWRTSGSSVGTTGTCASALSTS